MYAINRRYETVNYLEAVLKAGRLIVGIFGDGGVRSMRNARPHTFTLRIVPVFVWRLMHLRSHLYAVVRIRFHQRFCGEQAEICN